uniref:AIG1-type G domain-containing protein n=1 Tax=Poecilia latipinna TaxID=48699 RepID=A0A3B3TKU6_9TELE
AEMLPQKKNHPNTVDLERKFMMIGGLLTGKSSTGNTILGKNEFGFPKSIGRTTHSEISHGVVEGRRLTVVDSPGWYYVNTLQETNEMDKLEIENSVNLCPPGPHAVLLVISKDLKALVEIMKPLTERVWRHCMVLFTRGDWINDVPVENYIVREGKELQELLEKCGNRYHVINPYHSQDPKLLEKIETLITINGFRHCSVDRSQGETLRKEMRDLTERASKRFDQVQKQRTKLNKLISGGLQASILKKKISHSSPCYRK